MKVLTFHAEKLHEDQVWRQIGKIAIWTSQQAMKITFFIYPFRAQVAGKDITDRIRTLFGMGHEIGQHTHFYAGTKIDKPEKVNGLSPENIAHCICRDFETLCQMGVTPKGFTAGSWVTNEAIWNKLIELGFIYDCSTRFPKLGRGSNSPYHRYQRFPQLYTNPKGDLLLMPTTCSLGEWFKWGRKTLTKGAIPYQLVYLHDYDLLSVRNYLLLWLFLVVNRRNRLVEAGALAELICSSRGAYYE